MKLSVSSLIGLLILGASLMTSCQKDNTPSFTDQVTGHWKSSAVMVNSTDLTALYKYSLDLQSTHEFDLDLTTPVNGSSSTYSDSGDWMEVPEKQDLVLTFNGTGKTITYDVTIVSETQMIASYTQDGSRFEITFDRVSQ